jgi:hypothetical protein
MKAQPDTKRDFRSEDHIARCMLLKRLIEIDAELREIVSGLQQLGIAHPIEVFSEIAAAFGRETYLDDLKCDAANERLANHQLLHRRGGKARLKTENGSNRKMSPAGQEPGP